MIYESLVPKWSTCPLLTPRLPSIGFAVAAGRAVTRGEAGLTTPSWSRYANSMPNPNPNPDPDTGPDPNPNQSLQEELKTVQRDAGYSGVSVSVLYVCGTDHARYCSNGFGREGQGVIVVPRNTDRPITVRPERLVCARV